MIVAPSGPDQDFFGSRLPPTSLSQVSAGRKIQSLGSASCFDVPEQDNIDQQSFLPAFATP